MTDLYVAAIEAEIASQFFAIRDCLVTGVGTIAAAFELSAVLALNQHIDRVINVGTAGSIDGTAGIVVPSAICLRNFSHVQIKELIGYDQYPALDTGIVGPVLATGDTFVDHPVVQQYLLDQGVSIVDMEAYALAWVARKHGVEFHCVKFISDNTNEEAAGDWKHSLEVAARELADHCTQHFD